MADRNTSILHKYLNKVSNGSKKVSMKDLDIITKMYQQSTKAKHFYLHKAPSLFTDSPKQNYLVENVAPNHFVHHASKLFTDPKFVASQLDKSMVQPYLRQQKEPRAKRIINQYAKLYHARHQFLSTSNYNVNCMLNADNKTIDRHNYMKYGNYQRANQASKQIKGLLKQVNTNSKIEAKAFNKLYDLGDAAVIKKTNPKRIEQLDTRRTINKRSHLDQFNMIHIQSSYGQLFCSAFSNHIKNITDSMKRSRKRTISQGMENKLKELNLGTKFHHANQVSHHQSNNVHKYNVERNQQNQQRANQQRQRQNPKQDPGYGFQM